MFPNVCASFLIMINGLIVPFLRPLIMSFQRTYLRSDLLRMLTRILQRVLHPTFRVGRYIVRNIARTIGERLHRLFLCLNLCIARFFQAFGSLIRMVSSVVVRLNPRYKDFQLRFLRLLRKRVRRPNRASFPSPMPMRIFSRNHTNYHPILEKRPFTLPRPSEIQSHTNSQVRAFLTRCPMEICNNPL